jgi:hypothetical protein
MSKEIVIDSDIKGVEHLISNNHLLAKNEELKGIILKKLGDSYIARYRIYGFKDKVTKNYRDSSVRLTDEDIDNLLPFGIKYYNEVYLVNKEGKDAGFYCFDDNKTLNDGKFKGLIFKEYSKEFRCVGKLDNLTNPYNSEIKGLKELNEEEQDFLKVYCNTKYDYKSNPRKPKISGNSSDSSPSPSKYNEDSEPVNIEAEISNDIPEEKVSSDPQVVPEDKIKVKYFRKGIPKSVKRDVWEKYIGDVTKADCPCCKIRTIHILSFDCGHVVAVKNGGDNSIYNLRPICKDCNGAMRTRNMEEFAIEWYGTKI